MHPAYSVILFTTASGAGYGLLVWLALASLFDWTPIKSASGFTGFGLALGLITAGLLSSTAHLGRPERAWRAFSQWRTSWLSREGVLAVATYVPAGLMACGWAIAEDNTGIYALSALLTIPLALATVVSTGMIYASLPTIRQWHQPLTVPVYLAFSLASGAVLLTLFLALFDGEEAGGAMLAFVMLAVAALLKWLYWRRIDEEPRDLTAADATGLGRLGTVRVLEQPHTQANYVMREMGYAVARKHALKLRQAVFLFAFAVPALLVLGVFEAAPWIGVAAASLASLSMALGLFVERWLFFAEAQHVVTLYYGAEAA
ncbi:MAG: DmsC/YnfH family molybdoenzyme membrane anchor subunit [Hyphomicrobiaceae bacterium]|nr:DmsC/YnfH family molybdoenzyme membrane anchor subunit [Hyphomicrobiaceae bacterium]